MLLSIFAVVLIGIGSLSFALTHSSGSASPEPQFTDASRSGLAIVPASGYSPPAYIPYYCYGGDDSAGNGATCICSYGGSYPTCNVIPCPAGYSGTYPNCSASPACNGDGANCASPSASCPAGYALNSNGECTFTGCPAGYAENGSGSCIRSCTPQYLCGTDNNLYHEDASCNITASPVETCGYGCSGSECLPPPAPVVVAFSVSPSLVKSGSTATIAWNVQNVSSCSVSGTNGDGPWTGPSGSQTSAAITGQVIYTLHCAVISGAKNADGSDAGWSDQAVTVNIAPTYQER